MLPLHHSPITCATGMSINESGGVVKIYLWASKGAGYRVKGEHGGAAPENKKRSPYGLLSGSNRIRTYDTPGMNRML